MRRRWSSSKSGAFLLPICSNLAGQSNRAVYVMSSTLRAVRKEGRASSSFITEHTRICLANSFPLKRVVVIISPPTEQAKPADVTHVTDDPYSLLLPFIFSLGAFPNFHGHFPLCLSKNLTDSFPYPLSLPPKYPRWVSSFCSSPPV